MKLNAAQILLEAHDADREALVSTTKRLSVGELRERVARTAAAFRQRGLAPGDRVAIALNDSFTWVCAFLGTIHAGGVAVGVSPRMPEAQWRAILDEADFRIVVAETREKSLPAWHARILLRSELEQSLSTIEPIAPELRDPAAPAFWTYSSGTSGKPKAIVHAHRSVLAVERTSVQRLGLHAGDRLYSSSRLFFTYPLANCLLAGLKLGAALILDPAWPTAAHVASIVRAQRASALFSVPAMYRDLLREGLAGPLVRDGLRLCVSAGEALPQGLRQAWLEQTGLAIVNGFGASETLTLVLVDRDGSGFLPSPDVQIRAKDPSSLPTRILIDTPTLGLGYWRGVGAGIEGFGGERGSGGDGEGYMPADLLRESPPGRWRFVGREDSLVKVNGRWVDLVELEERVASCVSIIEAAAVSVPDEDGVNAIALFYVARPQPSPEEIVEGLEAGTRELPQHQRPRWLHPISSLPRTATGKLLRRELAELHRTLQT